MNAMPKVVSIKARAAPPAGARHPPNRPRPWVLVIDSPKAYLLAAVLGVVALLVAGAMANDMLATPRGLACEASHAAATEQAPPSHAIDGGYGMSATWRGADPSAAAGSMTTLAPASLSRRWKSGEARMIVPAAARRRSTAASGSSSEVGRSLR